MKVLLQDVTSKYITDPNYVLPNMPKNAQYHFAKVLPTVFFGKGQTYWSELDPAAVSILLQLLEGTLLVDHVALVLRDAGLERINSFTFGDYEYFEVRDPRVAGSPRMLCRVRLSGPGALVDGVEIFLDAHFDGEAPDPDYPAIATGFLHTINEGKPGEIKGLQDVMEATETQRRDSMLIANGLLHDSLPSRQSILTSFTRTMPIPRCERHPGYPVKFISPSF